MHGLLSVKERGLDNVGAAAVTQSDIEKSYDSLSTLRITRWLISRGVPSPLAACALRHQMCPAIVEEVCDAEVKLEAEQLVG